MDLPDPPATDPPAADPSASGGPASGGLAAGELVGVRVDCVNPGTVDTPWVRRLLGQAADPAARSTTGTALAIDGGMDALRLRSGGGQS